MKTVKLNTAIYLSREVYLALALRAQSWPTRSIHQWVDSEIRRLLSLPPALGQEIHFSRSAKKGLRTQAKRSRCPSCARIMTLDSKGRWPRHKTGIWPGEHPQCPASLTQAALPR